MDIKEAYKELGLDASANDAQLKSQWRRLVSRWHPDRNRASEAPLRIQRINKAYHHLCQYRSELACGAKLPMPVGRVRARGSASWRRAARPARGVVSSSVRHSLAGCGARKPAKTAMATDASVSPAFHAKAKASVQ